MNRFALLICLLIFSSCLFSQNQSLESKIDSVIRNKKAQIGIAVIYDNEILTIQNDSLYPMMSVYKFHQALAVLDHLEKNNLPLETEIHIKKSDLDPNTYSPLYKKYPNGNISLSIGELLKYSVSQSDNNACDILFDYLGGTGTVNRYIRQSGFQDISILATEKEMHEHSAKEYLNLTTPLSSLQLMKKFMESEILATAHREFLTRALEETNTGNNKLKGLLPKNTIVGHKTGNSSRDSNGMKAGDNDLGFIRLPNGKQYYIGVFITKSFENDEMNARIIAEISKLVYEHISEKGRL